MPFLALPCPPANHLMSFEQNMYVKMLLSLYSILP
jgi:hypothetical protein